MFDSLLLVVLLTSFVGADSGLSLRKYFFCIFFTVTALFHCLKVMRLFRSSQPVKFKYKDYVLLYYNSQF